MVKSKHSKLRAWGRWGVWVFAGMLVAITMTSIWVSMFFDATYEFSEPDQDQVWIGMDFYQTRLSIEYYPKQRAHWRDGPNPGLRLDFGSTDYAAPTESPWWAGLRTWKGGGGFGGFYGLELPMVYPTALMVGWALWLARARRRLRRLKGSCRVCGYSLDGLNRAVCPECGEKIV